MFESDKRSLHPHKRALYPQKRALYPHKPITQAIRPQPARANTRRRERMSKSVSERGSERNEIRTWKRERERGKGG